MPISSLNTNTIPHSLCQHTSTLRKPLIQSKNSSQTQLQVCNNKCREGQCIFMSQSKDSSTYFCTGVTVLFSCKLTSCTSLVGLHTFVFSAGIGLTLGKGGQEGIPLPPNIFLPMNSLLLATELKRANKIME